MPLTQTAVGNHVNLYPENDLQLQLMAVLAAGCLVALVIVGFQEVSYRGQSSSCGSFFLRFDDCSGLDYSESTTVVVRLAVAAFVLGAAAVIFRHDNGHRPAPRTTTRHLI